MEGREAIPSMGKKNMRTVHESGFKMDMQSWLNFAHDNDGGTHK